MQYSPSAPASPVALPGGLIKPGKRSKGSKENVKEPGSTPREIVLVKNLIWLYFFLLIFEGALRKWILPAYATPLLIVRDPVVIAIYLCAVRARVFPANAFMWSLGFIAVGCLFVGWMAPGNTIPTTLFGFRCNFLHFPLIFVMRRVLEPRDVKKFCFWILVLAIPMALLMALQFLAPPNSIINSGITDDFGQIRGARGHIRPPGTFSFVTGPIYFFGIVAAVLLNTQFIRRRDLPYPSWFIAVGYGALFLAMVVSVSRALVVNVGLVFFMALIVTIFLRPNLVPRWLAMIAILSMVAIGTSHTSLVQEGMSTMDERVSSAGQTEGGASGFVSRYLVEYTAPFEVAGETPLLGYGLGVGTQGGQALLGPEGHPVWAEQDWRRVVQESGPVLGGFFIMWRIALTLYMGRLVLKAAFQGNTLPILLFAISWSMVLVTMLSQPTILGFIAFGGGLTLSAVKRERNAVPLRGRHIRRQVLNQLPPAYASQTSTIA